MEICMRLMFDCSCGVDDDDNDGVLPCLLLLLRLYLFSLSRTGCLSLPFLVARSQSLFFAAGWWGKKRVVGGTTSHTLKTLTHTHTHTHTYTHMLLLEKMIRKAGYEIRKNLPYN